MFPGLLSGIQSDGRADKTYIGQKFKQTLKKMIEKEPNRFKLK
jgi:hypothetical protein